MRAIAALVLGVVMAFVTAPAYAVAFPFPAPQGRVVDETPTAISVLSTQTVQQVQRYLDWAYVEQNGCVKRVEVNKPRLYVCNGAQVVFTFAALDPGPFGYRSQTNGDVLDSSGPG